MHAFRVHHNIEIDTARFEEGKRRPRRRDLRIGNRYSVACRQRRDADAGAFRVAPAAFAFDTLT